jgi:hypothetical protein
VTSAQQLPPDRGEGLDVAATSVGGQYEFHEARAGLNAT